VKVKDVPQDTTFLGDVRAVSYAVTDEGKYSLTPSTGWSAVSQANDVAWEVINEDVEIALDSIAAGNHSPLAYHMAKHQMDVPLLASYAKLPKWRVKRHLKAKIYHKLSPAILARYAEVFNIAVSELDQLPSA